MIHCRPAEARDLPGIAAIQAASPETAVWDPADYLAHRCMVAEVNGVLAGFIVIRNTFGREFEVLNLAVDPHLRWRGVGRAMLADAIEPGAVYFLEVRESNQPARNLYKQIGFAEVGLRPGYYSNPHENGIVMSFRS